MKRVSFLLIIVALLTGSMSCSSTLPAQYVLAISSTFGGLVSTPGEGTRTYNLGTKVDLVATATAGYRFVEWSGEVATIADVSACTTTITMNDNYLIIANFEEEEEAVHFSDRNLEAAVRQAIGVPEQPVYPSDLNLITHFSASGRSIAHLTGLEHCTGLTWLWLDGNQISDISALTNLTNLAWLSLDGNQIGDISALTNLTNLTWLSLHGNQISDISALVDNPGLGVWDTVILSHNPLSEQSVDDYIPMLAARGVTVYIDRVNVDDPGLE